MTRKEFETRLVQRATTDRGFKKMLLNDTNQAIKVEFSEHLPNNIEIYVHEENENVYHFVIPWNPFTVSDGQLSDDDLEIIAGGTYDCTGIVLSTALCTINKDF